MQLMLVVSDQMQGEVHQIDYSNTLFKDPLESKVYMALPKHFNKKITNKVCRFIEILSGLRESQRIWYNVMYGNLINLGLNLLQAAPCVLFDQRVAVLFNFDEFLTVGDDKKELHN